MNINELLKMMVEAEASDLHLKVPSPPVLRIHGKLIPQDNISALVASDLDELTKQILLADQLAAFGRDKEFDGAYSVPGLGRFRVNIMLQRGTPCIAVRAIPLSIASSDELGVPTICKELVMKPKGLILITGPSSSGKSTTLAYLINYMNETARRIIITVEDPIEYLYSDNKCLIAQRDLGDDTLSYVKALKACLRHDPE